MLLDREMAGRLAVVGQILSQLIFFSLEKKERK